MDDAPFPAGPTAIWLGLVVPKRHARRAVTRSLLKRQMRAAVQSESQLPFGLWVLRLRAPFARERYPSAASRQLADDARGELLSMLGRFTPSSV